MRNRFFHRPELHTAISGTEKRASWLELLYDLVFVASFIQLGSGLVKEFSLAAVGTFAIIFSALWFTWTGFTFYSNRFNVDDFVHRGLVFLQMLAIAGMTEFASHVVNHDSRMFSFSYAFAQLINAIMYYRSWSQSQLGSKYSRFWGILILGNSALWLLSAFFDEPINYVFWLSGLVSIIIGSFSGQSRHINRDAPYDQAHLSNRFGLLTIIVIGEVFFQATSSLALREASFGEFFLVIFTLIVTASIWWIYFDDIGGSRLKPAKYSFNFWLFGHIPLHGSIVAVGVAIARIIQLDLSETVPEAQRWLICASLAIAFSSVALLDWATERKQAEMNERVRLTARLVSAILLFLLAPAGRGMSAPVFLGIISVLCIAQVFFDMIIAPFDFSESSEGPVKIRSYTEIAKERLGGSTVVRTNRPLVRNAIRKGTPTELRRDLYFALIETSWPRFLGWVVVAYLIVNALFAGLYMIQPGSIAHSRSDSFADAFYFSVQTLATIGYGDLHPASDYGNAISIAEALVGLMGVAFVTGLMFARASKPRAGIIFSKTLVINKLDGKRFLMFRTGNTRGNEIVSAEITMTVLRDEISDEGHQMRRMHDLKLSRHRSPFFALTWLVLHEIDESSPFYNVNSLSDLDPSIVSFTCILMGHDSTYGQTIYTRHVYYPDDLHVNAKFVDVLGEAPDGRFVVDYSKFHDVITEST